MLERQFPVIAHDDPVPGIEGRERAADTGIDRIQDAFKAGGLIEGLAERISSRELQADTPTIIIKNMMISPFARSIRNTVALDMAEKSMMTKSNALVRRNGKKVSDRKKSRANESPKRLVHPSANLIKIKRSHRGE